MRDNFDEKGEFMKKNNSVIKRIIILALVIASVATTSFAAWWGTPGYEWCFANGITAAMARASLDRDVTNEDFYAILLRYLRVKGITKHSDVSGAQSNGYTENYNPIFSGMISAIDKYLRKTKLTPEEFRQVISYIDHAHSNVSSHLSLVNREDAKDFFLYLSLAKYKAATMIDAKSYRDAQLAKYSNVKYKEIFNYGMKPYYGKITRKEFLVLMYTLLSESGNPSADSVIKAFHESGVLLGWDDDLWLEERLTYAEMFTFFYRFEAFDFSGNKQVKVEEEENVEEQNAEVRAE